MTLHIHIGQAHHPGANSILRAMTSVLLKWKTFSPIDSAFIELDTPTPCTTSIFAFISIGFACRGILEFICGLGR